MDILNEKDIDLDVVEYLQQPPTHDELIQVLDLLGLQPRELMRKHEAPYKDNDIDNPALTRDQLIQLMIDNPILIERPIIINGDKATIGRPPEKVLDIL
jgi:arsenate reductase